MNLSHSKKNYKYYNFLFHFFHLSVIAFVLVAWYPNVTRLVHLVLCLIIGACWYGMGFFQKTGCCPLTEYHWQYKARQSMRPDENSYVSYMMAKLPFITHSEQQIDALSTRVFGLIFFISLYLNLYGLVKPPTH